MIYEIKVFLKIIMVAFIVTITGMTNVYADTITFSDTIQGELSGEWTGVIEQPGWVWIWDKVDDVGVTQFNIDGFNSSLGTLDEIQFSLDVTVSGSVTFTGGAGEGGGTFTRNTWGQINLLNAGFPLWANAQTELWSMDLSDTESRTESGVFTPAQSAATYNLTDSNSFNSYINDGIISIGAASALQPGGTLINGVGNITAYSNIVTGVLDVTYIYTPSVEVAAPVPEPATMLLFGIGLLGLAGAGRRKNR